ncbi:hypothetical protein ACI78R_18190 [Geodermatophilus sp. SYSU D01106]
MATDVSEPTRKLARRDIFLTLGVLVLTLLGGAGAMRWPTLLGVALVATLLAALIARTRRGYFSKPYFSPVWITVALLATVGIGGFLFAADLVDAGGASIRIVVPDRVAWSTLTLFAQVVSWLIAGALLQSLFRRRATPAARADATALRDVVPPALRSWFLPAAAAPILVLTVGVGGDLLSRSSYLPIRSGTSVLGLAGTLALGGAVLAGHLAASSIGLRRASAVTLMAAYAIYFFSMGSRRLALVPILLVLGYCAYRGTRRRAVKLAVAAAMSLALLPIPLHLRTGNTHGLFPYLERMLSFSYGNVEWADAVNNILVAFPIAAATAFMEPQLPTSWLWISLNPAPGSVAGWYEIYQSLRLNYYTPYSTVGELGNYGWLVTAVMAAAAGAILSYLDGRVGWYFRTGHGMYALALLGMCSLFALTILQYNLRSSVRLLLYAIIADLVLRYITRARLSRRAAADAVAGAAPNAPRAHALL